MADVASFPRHLILAGAAIFGMLLTLGVHILGQRLHLNLGDLWNADHGTVPVSAAIAWWLIAGAGLATGYVTAILLQSAVSGQLPRSLRRILIMIGVILLAAAGQAASEPNPIPTISGLLAGIAALALGAAMAFCGAYFALKRS